MSFFDYYDKYKAFLSQASDFSLPLYSHKVILRRFMKRLILLIVLLIVALFDISAQDRLHPTHTSTTNSDEIKSFITQLYNIKLYEDYDFLQKHCSAELLQKLQDAYPYDTDGRAYATWLFRSCQQDDKPGADNRTIMLEVKADGDWFVYTALDMGWKFTNKIKITNKGGEIIIEDVCAVKE
ncbi:MAG: hypothetical protein IKJ20_04550 [Alistipes sp.]|nr:hypothetical protein [Alistipes sp.]